MPNGGGIKAGMNGGINAGVGTDGSSRSINSLHGKNGRMMHRDHHNHRHGGRGGKAHAKTSCPYPCMDRLLAWAKDYCGEFFYVLSWWSFSILFSLYNKEVFGEKKLDFPYPVTLTSTNMFFQWAAAKLLVKRWNRARVIDSSLGVEGEEEVDESSIHDDHDDVDSFSDDVDSFSAGGHIQREQITPSDSIPKLGWREYLTKVVPCAVGLAMDIGLSNIALVHVTVTFYTIIKSTGPIFALIFGVMLGNEDPDIRVLGVVVLIVAGLLMASEGNADFKWLDFFTVLLATAVSGLRWNLLQMLLQGVPLLPTPMHVIEAISPASGIIMALFGICWEIPTVGVKPFFDNFSVGETILIVVVGGTFAVGLSLTSFSLLKRTSVLMLMAFGAIKECLQIFMSVLFYGDSFGWKSLFGFIMVLGGVILYKYIRHLKHQPSSAESEGPSTFATHPENMDGFLMVEADHMDGYAMVEQASLLENKSDRSQQVHVY